MKRELAVLSSTAQAVHLVDLDSEAIEVSTAKESEGTSLSELGVEWRRGELTFTGSRDTASSKVYSARGDDLVAFISPLRDGEKAIMIVHEVEGRTEEFKTSYEGEENLVVDAEGEIQFAANASLVGATYRDGGNTTEINRSLSGESGVIDRPSEGTVYAYAPISGTEWTVIKRVPRENAFAIQQTVETDFWILIGLSLGALVVFGGVVGRDVGTSLRALSDRARALAEGDIDTEVETSRRLDEVGQVQNAFADTQEYLVTVADQADAIADQEFEDEALEADVPGRLGAALGAMHRDLEAFETEGADSDAFAPDATGDAGAAADAPESESDVPASEADDTDDEQTDEVADEPPVETAPDGGRR